MTGEPLTPAQQADFNESMLSLIERLSENVDRMIGVVAGLSADVIELKGGTPDPNLRRMQIKSLIEYADKHPESVID